jgi:uncharacterized membrane protein YidH (DUF202 family)
MNKKTLFLIIGFISFIIGFLAFILNLIGIEFAFLAWMRSISPMFATLGYVVMIVGGIVMAMLSVTDYEKEDSGRY